LLLTTFAKILETVVMKTRLLNHLTKLNTLTEEHFGFRIKLTTYTFTNKTSHAFNNKLMVRGIFCDLKKAFDSVSYDILLFKLIYYGIKGTNRALYKSYLYNRHQTVSLYEKDTYKFSFSNWAEVKSGIPQGSTLGPPLFLYTLMIY
jgi:hypothetical protein